MLDKSKEIDNLNPSVYRIYGILNFITGKLVYISLDPDVVDLEYELVYNTENYDIVSFSVLIT